MIRHCVGVLLVTLAMNGCTTYPLGIPEDQWLRMTSAQQHEARLEQARQDEAARQRYELRQQQLLAAQQRERDQREQRLRQAVPGDVVQCTLDQVMINLGKKKWRAANPLAVELLQGESLELVFERSDKTHQRRSATISFDRISVRLCNEHRADCAHLVATGRELQHGREVAVNTKSLRARLKCQYPPQFWHPG